MISALLNYVEREVIYLENLKKDGDEKGDMINKIDCFDSYDPIKHPGMDVVFGEEGIEVKDFIFTNPGSG